MQQKQVLIIVGVLLVLCACIVCSVSAYLIYSADSTRDTTDNNLINTPTAAPTAVPSTVTDSFDSNINNWDLSQIDDEDYGTVDFSIDGGKFNWSVNASKAVIFNEPFEYYDLVKDFEVALEGKLISGTRTADYGIAFRKLDDDNYYLFAVSDNLQQYVLDLKYQGEWDPVIDWKYSSAINSDQPNQLRVNVVGNKITLHVNNVSLGSITDTKIMAAGSIDIVIDVYEAGTASYQFDDFSFKNLD